MRKRGLILLIVTANEPDRGNPNLREWLRSDRALGIRHWAVTAPAGDTRADRMAAKPTAVSSTKHAAPAPRGSAASPAMFAAEDPDLPPLCSKALNKGEAEKALQQLDAQFVRECTKCGLHRSRTQTVFGVGHPRAKLMFVGEGPGADEDRQGEPFVGRAGQLLTKMIEAMTLTREQVYIANIVKSRPPGNRTPTDDEMATCVPYLWRQIAIVRPKVIVALGRPSSQTLLVTKTPIGRLRGEFHDFPAPALAHLGLPSCKLMPTFHPAYLLRSPGEKAKAWEDLKAVMHFLDIPLPSARS